MTVPWIRLAFLALLAGCNSSSSHATPPATSTRSATSAASAPPPAARAKSLELVEIETGGAQRDEPLPLVVALHGLGDSARGFAGLYAGFGAKARIALLQAPDAWGDGFSWFPFRPNDGDEIRAKGISAAAERVATSIEMLEKSRPTTGKAIVTGFSQGAMISFALAARHPNLLAAAIPISGVLPQPLWPAEDLEHKPHVVVIALHGDADELVPLAPTRRGVDALSRAGWDARLETFPGVGHRISSEVRARYFEVLGEEVAKARR